MTVRRALLMPLVPLYGGAVRWKRRMFEGGRLRQNALRDPVISVGSLSAGGAGKTPMVLLLTEMLQRREYAVRILTRGYGRERNEVERVDPDGDVRRYGDEPVMLAKRSGAPVYVGADRYRAGLMAERESAVKSVVYLLDDGFQHRKLRRDLDIVLLTRKDVDDALLPAGNLREPLSTVRKAGVVVVREDEVKLLNDFVSAQTREGGMPPIWVIRRLLNFGTTTRQEMPTRPVAFCGIARPESFFRMLEAEGVHAAETVVFGDHHGYRERDIDRLVAEAKRVSADGFVTTEKDAVKLSEGMRGRLERVGPLLIPELRVELMDERAVMEQMISMVRRLDRRRGR